MLCCRNASPMRSAWARPFASRLRCVEQSSSLASGGSKLPGAKLWRTTTTTPGARMASQTESCACAIDAARERKTTATSQHGATGNARSLIEHATERARYFMQPSARRVRSNVKTRHDDGELGAATRFAQQPCGIRCAHLADHGHKPG